MERDRGSGVGLWGGVRWSSGLGGRQGTLGWERHGTLEWEGSKEMWGGRHTLVRPQVEVPSNVIMVVG